MDNDFLTGLSISAACAALPVRKIYPTVEDVLDNEWPIEWSLRSTANNKTYIQGNMSMRKISDAVDFDYAKAALTVTAIMDSGGEVVFTTKNIGVTEWELGVLIYIQCTYNGTTYVLGLSVVKKDGTFGNVEFEKGTYYAFMDSSYQSVMFSDADVRFEMAKPEPEKVKIFAVMVRRHATVAKDMILGVSNRLDRGFLYSAITYERVFIWENYSPIKIPNGAVYANIIVPSDMNHAVLIGENHPTDARYVNRIYDGEYRTDGIFDVSGYADGEHYIVVKIGYISGANFPEDFDTSVIDFYFTDADGNVIEPTAYSYNGVILPALPEWDREMYPYAWITYNGTSDNVNYYRFIFSATPAVKRKDVLKGDILKVENTTAYIIYTDGDMTRWTLLFENNSNDNVLSTHKLLWCNEDILDNSGNVYFTASDRIPVCE